MNFYHSSSPYLIPLQSLDTFARLAALEAELFEKFGWSIRIFLWKNKYVVFAQIYATCGHEVSALGKAKSSMPVIEVYPIVTFNTSEPEFEMTPGMTIQNPKRLEQHIVRDIWQGTLFSESMIFPSIEHTLVSAGSKQPMRLQIPGQSPSVLSCLYGNWMEKSSKRAPYSYEDQKYCTSESNNHTN